MAGARELEAARREATELARQLAEAEARAEHVQEEAQAGREEQQRLAVQAAAASRGTAVPEALPLIVFLPADEL